MVSIPFPTSTSPGQRPQEGSGRLINCYVDAGGEVITPVWHRAPGLRHFGSDEVGDWTWWTPMPNMEWFNPREQPTGAGQFRGGVLVGSTLYAALGTTVYTVDSSGALTALTGTLPGTDKVFFARNNNASPQVAIVCAAGTFEVSGSSIVTYADSDVGAPDCVVFHDGYFMFGYGNGKIQASGVNVLSIDLLDFTTAESNPDGITQLWSFGGQLYAAGPATIEVYGQPINSTGFPLTRIGYNITPGLISPFCVAGFEPEFGNPPIYVGSDNTVRQLFGTSGAVGAATKISPPDLDALIAAVEDKTTLEALCYISRGHPMWQLSSSTWTWVYDVSTKTWHERKSYLLDRSRMTVSLHAFSKWICGDTESDTLLSIDPALHTEVGSPFPVTLESAPTKEFPNRMRVNRADFDFTVGVGDVTGEDPIETTPHVLVSWSDDGGYEWTDPWFRDLGPQAETQQRITVLNTGMSGPMGRRWRLEVSDPVWFGFMGGDMPVMTAQKQ